MATLTATTDDRAESDYGSDFDLEDENFVHKLLDELKHPQQVVTSSSIVFATNLFTSSPPADEDRHVVSTFFPDRPRASGPARTPASSRGRHAITIQDAIRFGSMPLDGISFPDLSQTLSSLKPEQSPTAASNVTVSKPNGPLSPQQSAADPRTPIERFRSFPKKPLAVTDISSGAWCELQYWYTLTLLPGGRKTRTAAMRGGTKVHKNLEDQVHTTVQVNIASREEAFALRLWNIIQGLRTLRDTGLTRELEVWGVVEGQVVNGIIDQVSHTSPNAKVEEKLNQNQNQSQSQSQEPQNEYHQQPSITSYFEPHRQQVYLTDVKTRGVNNLPSGAALRPSKVQLFLYHRLLGEMASGKFDFSTILTRYGLKPEARFSDAFMAQIGSLHDEVFDAQLDGEDSGTRSPTNLTDGRYPNSTPNMTPMMSTPSNLIRYRSLQSIIPLLQSELCENFPQGAGMLGDLVSIQYRHRADGEIIGSQTFATDPQALDNYLHLNLGWWLGRREAEGVPIEEAYKCRTCEFAEACEWRKDKEKELLRKASR